MPDYRIAIAGAAGRMGQMLVRTIQQTDNCVVAGALDAPGHDQLGRDAGELAGVGPLGAVITDNRQEALADCDAVIEFSLPDATIETLNVSSSQGIAHIIGTTGFSSSQETVIGQMAQSIPIVKAGNMSLGVNLLVQLTRRVAALLDEDFDIEVLEMHHKHKVDAPSGTALMLGEAAAAGRGVELTEVSDRGRDGITGARKKGSIGFAALRGGAVVGEHSVLFASDDERIELVHKANDRSIFAKGAVQAALWARGKEAGLYSMEDVLAL